VFSLLLTIILVGIGAGSLLSASVTRRTRQPAKWLIGVQGLFVAFTLAGLAAADAKDLEAIVAADPGFLAIVGRAADGSATADSAFSRTFTELWFNARPMLFEVGVPALLMGFGFPLANAIVQRAEASVGRRAGALYLANTCGAVCGALVAGFVLLPRAGIQTSATLLTVVAALAVVPLSISGGGRLQPAEGPPKGGHHRVSRWRPASAGRRSA